MPNILIITIAALFANLTAIGQNVFLIGTRSYPCSNAITFKSDADNRPDLDVFLAKGVESTLLAVSRRSLQGEEFTGKLLLDLEDGNVLTWNERVISEEVDNRAKAVYNLSVDQLNKLKASHIHTVKYTMIHDKEEQFSASNPGVKTNVVISEFYDPTEKSDHTDQSSDSLNTPAKVEVSETEPFAYVEQMPSFPDGTEAMYRYVYSSINYPADAKAKGISGQVIVQFVISAEGEIQKAKVIRGLGGGLNEEALRVVNSMPRWTPGMHNGRPVPVTFTLPIKFVY